MITLSKKLREKNSTSKQGACLIGAETRRASVRDKLLIKEVDELQVNLPPTCSTNFDDPNKLYEFDVTICPDEGYWSDGRFRFHIEVPEDYNIVPPKVTCLTKIWHPNITEDGAVCLSLLRQNAIDEMGWAPTRKLKDIVWGLNSLFLDLLNFDDPLNIEAAEHYVRDKDSFRAKVRDYIIRYAKR